MIKEYLILVKDDGTETSQEIINEIKEKYGAIYFRSRESSFLTIDGKCSNCGEMIGRPYGTYHCPKCGNVIEV